MKAVLVPLYFTSPEDPDFAAQLRALRGLLAEEAELLTPHALGSPLPAADAVVFPQMLGEAFRRLGQFKALGLPALVITSEFGTVSMWDWEINQVLRSEGVTVIAPYDLEQARLACRLLALRRGLRGAKFMVYQDNPGEGFQASIFKRFYWWEDECTARLQERFGVEIEKRSFKEMGARAQAIADSRARAAWMDWDSRVPLDNLPERALLSAVKVYLAVKDDLEGAGNVLAAGINCLNESHFSDSTPCLAWNMLFAERGLVWGCEADTVAMLTKHLAIHGLGASAMMTNLYPFLMGQAALKHERIPAFPQVAAEPENHILAAHCGYLGVVPQAFATQWSLRRKVLAIVNDNATAIDARLPEGPMALLKLVPPFETLSLVEGQIEGYAGFPGSDCLNGAVLRVPDGRRLMRDLASHHYILACGDLGAKVDLLGQLFGLKVERIA
jgi:hypothetical protein